MPILTLGELHTLRDAVISAHLSGSREALLATIDLAFRVTLPTAPVPGEQVLRDLDILNDTEVLADGSIPLLIWLTNAESLAGGQVERITFRRAIEQISSRNPPVRAVHHGLPLIVPHIPRTYRVEHLVMVAVAGLLVGGLVSGLVWRGQEARGGALDGCRDSLARLDTQSKLPEVTVNDLKNGIGGHVSRCRALLEATDAR